ncbi:hypothetical protein [Treponema putidum]|uniref:Uncharacterized protein n=1 Tax=Treponema putidum TaxID=221027 RepID=A0AAE9MUL9_9SPIR|nr:hypothetical protein [Treponema putidum]UTY34056.1 hypothetical protein E4N74_08585 [Treponema putidum]
MKIISEYGIQGNIVYGANSSYVYDEQIQNSFYEFEKYRKTNIGDISSVNGSCLEFIDEIIYKYLKQNLNL